MTQDIQLFDFNGLQLRALLINGEPWFVAMDVARALEYSDPYEMTKRLTPTEIQNRQIAGFGNRGINLINEPGLYKAIFKSHKPEAENFSNWVTHEVLPTIRKTGQYQAPQTLEQRSLAIMQELTAVVQEQKAQLEAAKPKVEAFEDFLSAEGSCSVGDATKGLARLRELLLPPIEELAQLER